MNFCIQFLGNRVVSAGCHINDVMNFGLELSADMNVSAGCHINDVMNATLQHYQV